MVSSFDTYQNKYKPLMYDVKNMAKPKKAHLQEQKVDGI